MTWNAPRLIVIDRQAEWRDMATRALEGAGFSVRALGTYDFAAVGPALTEAATDFVVLGCARVDVAEEVLITQLVERGDPVLVLCALVPPRVMRDVFLLGAKDVADKAYSPAGIVAIVNDALERARRVPSYW
jgi:DNA-binding NtrC family response regulator